MGYDTYYNLSVRRAEDPYKEVDYEKDAEALDAVADIRKISECANRAFDDTGGGCDPVRHWDDMDEEFIRLSERWPQFVFMVSGDGDDSQDKWEAWFFRGQSETQYVNIPLPKMFAKRKTIQAGVVGVDSGQLVICDPSYIDSQWKKDEVQRATHTIHRHKDGSLWQFCFPGCECMHGVNPFPGTYETVIPKYGKTPNQLVEDGEFTDSGRDPFEGMVENFSYDAVSRVTLGNPGYGQIYYSMGHEGCAVAIGNFGGDGVFPVEVEVEDDLVCKIIVTLHD